MSYIKEMFETHPVTPTVDHADTLECITACYSCAEACNACADACLGEKEVSHFITCIRMNQDCSDLCLAVARIVSRLTNTDSEVVEALLRACAQVCRLCGEGCAVHSEAMPHCRVCAEACERCADACEQLLRDQTQPKS